MKRGKESMRISTFVTAIGLMLLGTIAQAQTVTYDFDRTANFSKFKTYAWTPGTELTDPLNHERVVRSVDSQLAAKGLTKVDASANPDVLVAYHASFEKNLQLNALGSGWGRFGGLRSGTITTETIVMGTLVVDIMDASKRAMVWRGIANGEIDAKAKPEKREKTINRAAQKLFKNYPSAS